MHSYIFRDEFCCSGISRGGGGQHRKSATAAVAYTNISFYVYHSFSIEHPWKRSSAINDDDDGVDNDVIWS